MKFELCKKYGLGVFDMGSYLQNGTFMGCKAIKASEVEALLSSGVEVFGKEEALSLVDTDKSITRKKFESDTHQGLLIGYKPIEKEQPVTIKEVTEKLEDVLVLINVDGAFKKDTENLITRLKATKELR